MTTIMTTIVVATLVAWRHLHLKIYSVKTLSTLKPTSCCKEGSTSHSRRCCNLSEINTLIQEIHFASIWKITNKKLLFSSCCCNLSAVDPSDFCVSSKTFLFVLFTRQTPSLDQGRTCKTSLLWFEMFFLVNKFWEAKTFDPPPPCPPFLFSFYDLNWNNLLQLFSWCLIWSNCLEEIWDWV